MLSKNGIIAIIITLSCALLVYGYSTSNLGNLLVRGNTTLNGSVITYTAASGVVRMTFDTANGTIDGSTLTANFSEVNANSSWEHLSYPASCPANSAVTEIGDSNVCTDSWVNIGGDTMTGPLNMGEQNITNATYISASDAIIISGETGLTGTATVRDSGGSADCNLVYNGGILTNTTCTWS